MKRWDRNGLMNRCFWTGFILLLLVLTIKAQTTGKIESMGLYEKDLALMGENRKGPYFLPDSLIIDRSEQVFLDGEAVPPSLYKFDYLDGEIRFRHIVSENTQIRIVYNVSPYDLPQTVYHRQLRTRVENAPTGTSSPRVRQRETMGERDYAAELQKNGSITRGVTVGNNRGLKVNSSLNLNVSGQIAEQVEVVAALTDQSTPIQPEGTTQNLQEIDKVFVKLRSPHLSATLGDYQLELSETQFARYRRKLQGAMGEAHYDRFDLKVSGAVSRGKFRSQQIQGREGFQGPYQLKGEQGQIAIIVLAGTERVYVDGEEMVRGENNDYIIDYAAAQITFSRRRLITGDSRIVVDFQYSDEQFRRHLYTARTRGRLWQDRIQIGAALIHEADDKNNPLDVSVTDERLQVLREAGDDPEKAVIDGVERVGDGEGRYILTEAGHYRYAGQDSGRYQITFSDVGAGNGDYTYSGGGAYEFVGENEGRYAPVILLPTARRHDVFDFNVAVTPVSWFSAAGEWAISQFDRNTYSGFDDGDNQGLAQEYHISLNPDSLAGLGRLTVQGRYRTIDNQFRDIDRTTEVEYNRKWDLPEDTERQEETGEATLRYEPLRGWFLSAGYGRIRKGSDFSSDRTEFQSGWSRTRAFEYSYRYERIQREQNVSNSGDWRRQRGKVSAQLWKVRPFLNYEAETKKEQWTDSLQTGFRFDDMTGGVQFKTGPRFNAVAEWGIRKDDDYTASGRFTPRSEANTRRIRMEYSPSGSFGTSVSYTHRERSYSDSTTSDNRTDLADVQIRLSPWRRAVSGNLNYQISNTATAKKERVYIKVSEGDGNYRFDEELNEYVNDPLGDTILRILTTDDFVPVIELKTSARLRLDPGRFFPKRGTDDRAFWQEALSALSSESYVAIDERTQEEDVWDIYLLDLSRFRQPDVTVFGSLNVRQDFYVFEHGRAFSLRLRHERRDEKNNQYLDGGQDRLERENQVRVTNRWSRSFSSRADLSRSRIRRLFSDSGRRDRDIHSTAMELDLSYRPTSVLEMAVETRFSLEEDRVYDDPTRLRALAVTPRFTYSVRGHGRLRGKVEYSFVDSDPKDRLIPYEMARGRSLGRSMRWDLRFDYRLSETINVVFSYTGRNEPERNRTIHTGQAQVTAAFR
jgi:hypothetical protein